MRGAHTATVAGPVAPFPFAPRDGAIAHSSRTTAGGDKSKGNKDIPTSRNGFFWCIFIGQWLLTVTAPGYDSCDRLVMVDFQKDFV